MSGASMPGTNAAAGRRARPAAPATAAAAGRRHRPGAPRRASPPTTSSSTVTRRRPLRARPMRHPAERPRRAGLAPRSPSPAARSARRRPTGALGARQPRRPPGARTGRRPGRDRDGVEPRRPDGVAAPRGPRSPAHAVARGARRVARPLARPRTASRRRARHRRDAVAPSYDVTPRPPLPGRRRRGPGRTAPSPGRPSPVARSSPWLTPVHDQVDDGLAGHRRRGAARRRPRSTRCAGRATRRWSPICARTSDAGRGGARRRPRRQPRRLADARWRWTDLEETCRGPLAWDLAVLAGERRATHGGRRALAAYAAGRGHRGARRARARPVRRRPAGRGRRLGRGHGRGGPRRGTPACRRALARRHARPGRLTAARRGPAPAGLPCAAVAGFRDVVGGCCRPGWTCWASRPGVTGGRGRDGTAPRAGRRACAPPPPASGRGRSATPPTWTAPPTPARSSGPGCPSRRTPAQGKDRPVLVVARGEGEDLLGLMLSSQSHRADDPTGWGSARAPGTVRAATPTSASTGSSRSPSRGSVARARSCRATASTASPTGCAATTAGAERALVPPVSGRREPLSLYAPEGAPRAKRAGKMPPSEWSSHRVARIRTRTGC